MSETDSELFAGVQARDAAAWERFVDRFGGLVASVPSRAGLEPADVDDVVQTTWIQLYRHAAAIRTPRSLVSWVLTTAQRATWRVASRRVPSAADLPDEALEGAPDASLEVERLEVAQRVREELAELSKPCQRLLEALFLRAEVPSYSDLARELEVPVGSLGPTRQRCLAGLATRLERRGVLGEDGG